MLDVTYQTSLLPHAAARAPAAGRPAPISEMRPGLSALRTATMTPERHPLHGARSESNPSSILQRVRAARENARAVRGTSPPRCGRRRTRPGSRLPHAHGRRASERDPAQFFDWVKYRSHLFRGVAVGTMLRDERFHFLRLGTFLERADNTARILDVKFHAVRSDFFGGRQREGPGIRLLSLERASCAASPGFEIYRKVYRDVIRPETGGRPADPARRHAALAARVHERGGRQPGSGRQRPVRRDPAPGRPAAAPTCSTAASTRSSPPACMPSSRSSSTASMCSGSRISRDFLVPAAA